MTPVHQRSIELEDRMPRPFPLELVLTLCNQGKFSEAEELTAQWIARAEQIYELTHGKHSGV